MKKWIISAGGVVGAIIILLVLGISSLGPIIKTAVNTYGPKVTKTELRLSDVEVSILSGQAKLKDFYLGNPEGFKSPQAMTVATIYVDLDEESVAGDTIIIDKIEVVGPEITYEKVGRTDNFKTILKNVKRSASKEESSNKQSKNKGEGKKLLIRDFIIKGGKVNLTMEVLGDSTIHAALPDLHLKDIGKKKEGVPPAEAFNEIFAALYAQITSPEVTSNLNQELKKFGVTVQTAGEKVRKGLEDAVGRIKGWLGK